MKNNTTSGMDRPVNDESDLTQDDSKLTFRDWLLMLGAFAVVVVPLLGNSAHEGYQKVLATLSALFQ